jgi:hypothetical protein
MSIRKEKEKDFYILHMDTFKKLGLQDPYFMIKAAFFQKGKYGRQIQFFESELRKGEDIYMEFYDNVKDGNGKDIDVVPMFSDRQLFKYRYNPYFEEEYEQKEGISGKGDPYMTFTVPVTELLAVMTDGSEITYNLYEKRKADLETKKDEDDLPKLQKTLFPNFEDQFPSAEAITLEKDEEESTSDILQRISLDFLKLAKKLK